MTHDYHLENRVRKNLALRDKRRDMMSLPPEKALEEILSASLPAQLVQSFSEQDLYLLVHDIGLADALPILALAHSDQWGYMLDVEVWTRDQLELDAVTHWFKVLLLSDQKRMVRWLLAERLEFLELYLFRNIEVIIREENEDPSDFPDGFFTVDDYFYIRVKEKPETLVLREGDDPVSQDDLDEVIRTMLNQILEIDYYLYQQVMLEAMTVIAAEVEEEDFRLRNVRLAEKGFLPFDEALEIYSPLDPDQIRQTSPRRTPLLPSDPDWMPAPIIPVQAIRDRNLFSESLDALGGRYDLTDLEMEFASLCNQIIAADQKMIRDKEVLAHIVKKASFTISLGMEVLQEARGPLDTNARRLLLLEHSLKHLFRLGWGRIMGLKRRARHLLRDGWFGGQNRPLTFWGEQGLGVLGGLLVDKPLYYDNYTSGTLYREFKDLDDIRVTEKHLSDIQGYDELMAMVAPRMEAFAGRHLTFSSLLLTLWVHEQSGKSEETEGPVTMDDVRQWFATLWISDERGVEQRRGEIRDAEKQRMLGWLARRSGFTEEEISHRLGQALEDLFSEFENEYGAVHVTDLQSRYLPHLCIAES